MTKLKFWSILVLASTMTIIHAEAKKGDCEKIDYIYGDSYTTKDYEQVLSPQMVDRCLNSIEDIEHWKKHWQIDNPNNPLYLVSLTGANDKGTDREILMVLNEDSPSENAIYSPGGARYHKQSINIRLPISVHWSTLTGKLGYSSPTTGDKEFIYDTTHQRYHDSALWINGSLYLNLTTKDQYVFLEDINWGSRTFNLMPSIAATIADGDPVISFDDKAEANAHFQDRYDFATDIAKAAAIEFSKKEATHQKEEADFLYEKLQAQNEYDRLKTETAEKIRASSVISEMEKLTAALEQKNKEIIAISRKIDAARKRLEDERQTIKTWSDFLTTLDYVTKKYKVLWEKKYGNPLAQKVNRSANIAKPSSATWDGRAKSN